MQNKLKYYHRLWQIYRHYKRGKTLHTALPVRMWVELVSDCNLQCVMCPNKDLPKSQRGFMEWEVFKKTVDEAADFIFDMSLHHRGESLLHPEAVRFIAYAAGKIQHTNLHTNGTLLSPPIVRGLVESGLKRISFSFDGFARQDYEKIRRGADFQQVVDNIKSLLVYRKEVGQRYPRVAIEVIELSRSQLQHQDRSEFVRAFKQLGLDELVVKKPHNWAGYLDTHHARKKYAPCTFLWNALLVLYNGDVVPCAQDFFAQQVVGSVREQSLRQIWDGEPIRRLRRGLIDRQYQDFPACKECDRLWRDTYLGIPKEYLKQMILHKMP
jgi:radical SAM protein with 4Fe4S-binding SPASM domain